MKSAVIWRLFPLLAILVAACGGAPAAYPPYPPYPPYPAYADYPAYPPYPGGASSPAPASTKGARKVGTPGLGVNYSPPIIGTGTSGTYTVPTGDYVYGVFACAASSGSLVITPLTAQVTSAPALATITIPSGCVNLGPPYLPASPYAIADNSTLVFSGTSTYLVWLVRYVYP